MTSWLLTFTGSAGGLYIKQRDLINPEVYQHICNSYPELSKKMEKFFHYLEKTENMLEHYRNFTYELTNDFYLNLYSITKEPQIQPILVFVGGEKKVIENLSDCVYVYSLLESPKFSLVDFHDFVWKFGDRSNTSAKFLTMAGVTLKVPYNVKNDN